MEIRHFAQQSPVYVFQYASPQSFAPSGAATLGTSSGSPPASNTTSSSSAALPTIDATQIHAIVEQRCVPCHSIHPAAKFGFNAPPNGVVLESLDQLRAHLPEVQKQVSLRAMPLGNLTGMTDTERQALLMWIGHGAAGHLP